MSTESQRFASGLLDSGILLVGHGTRDEHGLAEFAEVVRDVAGPWHPVPVEGAFLELATPEISVGFDRLVERGARRIIVAPLLLFAAGHAKHDIPAAVQAAANRHSGVEWRQAEHLGCHPLLLELSVQRFRAAVDGARREPKQCRLLVVGRGSHDREATRETVLYAELLGTHLSLPDVQVGFLAMAKPRLPELLAVAAGSECDTIVVQPHLLFHGELLAEVQQCVGDWSLRAASKQWLVTGHLGPTSQVVAAVIDRCRQAKSAFGEPGARRS